MTSLHDHILVPLDASLLDETALRAARDLVRPCGRVSLVLIRGNGASESLSAFADSEDLSVADAAEIYLERTAARLRADGIKAEGVAVAGDRTATELVWSAERRDVTLILLPTEERARRRLFRHSLAEQLVVSSPVPVLVTPRSHQDEGIRDDELFALGA